MDYSSLLSKVIHAVTRAGELLVAEWQRPEGPRGAGDKADVDVEIEALLRPCLLDLLDGDFWGGGNRAFVERCPVLLGG